MIGKRGRPPKNQLVPTGIELPSAKEIISHKGYVSKKSKYHMRNNHINEDALFLYTPIDTLVAYSENRFLQLCDHMIMTLGPETVTMNEVEEIAHLYRDVISADKLYTTINSPSFDNSDIENKIILDQFDKLNKQIEKRKENLAIRSKDRKDARDLSKTKSVLDLIDGIKRTDLNAATEELANKYQEISKQYKSLEEYMEPKLKDNIIGN